MLQCPHCSASIEIAELRSERLLRPRTCRNCSGQYIEGGTTVAMMLVGAGTGLAGSLSTLGSFPKWAPLSVAFGSALLAVLYTHYNQPRRADELRTQLLLAVIVSPLAALFVWTIIRIAT